jgi:hypothetical protein
MDIIENGIGAGATRIKIEITESVKKNLLTITVSDNGKGISKDLLEKVMDPFFTTRTTRRVGLGLSLFHQASKQCNGKFHIRSKEHEGTEVFASFQLDHIDRVPLGDMAASITSLVMGNENVDFEYIHMMDGQSFHINTRQIREELGHVPINHPKVIRYIGNTIRESLEEIRQTQKNEVPQV